MEEAHLSAGEQEELEQEADTLSHAEEIKAGLYRVGQTLYSDEGICCSSVICPNE